jgi:hypothetical protein
MRSAIAQSRVLTGRGACLWLEVIQTGSRRRRMLDEKRRIVAER